MERRQSSRLLRLLSYRFCSCANVRYALLVWVADRPVSLARLTIASTLILYFRRVQESQEAYPYGAKRSQSRALSPDCSKVKGSCCCCNPCAANAQFWTKGEGKSGKYPRQNGLGNLWFGSATDSSQATATDSLQATAFAALVHRSRCLFSAGGCDCCIFCRFISAVFRWYESDS